ncbi:MAG: hypothetical protein RLZ63_726 [Pseudomonadota bacterium]
MKRWIVICLAFFNMSAQAYDGLSSELSHAVGGGLLAAGITYAYRDSPSRQWIGFAGSTAVIVLTETVSIAKGHKASSQLLDVASHALGAAVGAWYSDKYLLVPVVTRSSVGLVYSTRF